MKRQAELDLDSQEAALDAATMAYEEAAAPVLAVLARHGFDTVLEDMLRASRRGYSGKQWLNDLQAKAIKVCRELAEIGFAHPRIAEISRLSLNRPDRFQQLVRCVKPCCRPVSTPPAQLLEMNPGTYRTRSRRRVVALHAGLWPALLFSMRAMATWCLQWRRVGLGYVRHRQDAPLHWS